MARPPTYSPALGESICERVAQGETLASICRDLQIAYRTVNDWRNQYPEFGTKMGTARECGHDVIAESCLQIADTEPDPNRGKLRVWTRLQLLAKWDPRRYGERSQIDVGGQQGNPVQHVLNVEFVPGRKAE